MEEKYAKVLADASSQQFAKRLGEAAVIEIKFEPFYKFFLSLDVPENTESSLVLGCHKKIYDFPKQYMQICRIKDPPILADLETYPRGVIVAKNLEDTLKQIRSSGKRSFSEMLKRKVIEKKRADGHRSFDSAVAYAELLRDNEIADILLEYAKKGEPYFGFIRTDYLQLSPKEKDKPGWVDEVSIKGTYVFPVITIPGISQEHLRFFEDRERILLPGINH